MKKLHLLVLGLLATAAVCQAQITDAGWFNAQDGGIQATDVTVSLTGQGQDTNQTFQSDGLLAPQPSTPVAEAITPEIQALASGLQNDWEQIFSYVHDHIRYVHSFGSTKGAQLTLLEKSGNDFDQCALLVALLRAAGYTNSGYQFGWMGIPFDDPIAGNDLHHWLQLSFYNTNWSYTTNYLDKFFGARGYPLLVAADTNTFVFQRVWVNFVGDGNNFLLDPAFKTYSPVAGISLTNAIGFGSNVLMSAAAGIDAANYVTNLNEAALRGTLAGYTTNLLDYLQNNYPNASVEQILGGQDIIPAFSIGLQFQTYALTSGGHVSTTTNWVNEPTNLMSSLKITFAGTNYQCWMPQLEGQRLSLTFDAGGQAQLWQDDSLLASNSTSGSSSTTNVVVSINHPVGTWNFANNSVTDSGVADQTVTNSYQRTNATYALTYAFEPDWGWLHERQNQLDMYRQQGLGDNSRQVVSETLNIMGLDWMLQGQQVLEMSAAQTGMLPASYHRFGRMAQENGHGYYIDVYMQVFSCFPAGGADAANISKEHKFFDVNSYFFSAMENGLIEQSQSSNLVAASTVKMLQTANSMGQAVYLANSANWSTIKGQLANYSSTVSNTFAADINNGYTILMPQNGSNLLAGAGSWAGYGYVARQLTSTNENVQMKISGDFNGGYSSFSYLQIDVPYAGLNGDNQPTSFILPGSFTPGASATIADPVDTADGTFQVEHTDLSIGQGEPRGISLSRYYNGTRRYSNPAGMAGGWIHNYYVNASTISAPQAGLGGTTPAQAAPMLVATCAALGLYDGDNPDAKNWLVTALIAKWGIDQLSHNSVSVILGKDTAQFIKQPNGVFTPPANCTMTLAQSGSDYSLQTRHGNTLNFDALGRLATIVDQYNNSLSVAYLSSTSSLPQTVTDWKGRSLTFNYTGGQLTSVTDSSTPARTVAYGYSSTNTQGDLTSFTDAEGKTSTYTYDTNHQITATLDALNRLVVSNVYDGFSHVATQYTQGDTNKTWQIFWTGWQTTEQDPTGTHQDYFYDDQSRVTSRQDAFFNIAQTSYDGQNHVIKTISPLHETNQFIYDGNNNLIQSIDPLGFTNQFTYDGQNNLISSTDARGNQSTFGYNGQFSLIGQTNGAGDFVNYAFNSDGTIQSRTDSGGLTQFGYDGNGVVNLITYPGSLGHESFANSLLGDVTSHTDANGNVTTYACNNRREMTNSVAPTSLSTSVAFDAVGNVASTTDGRGNTVSNTWSVTRHLLSTTLPSTPQGVPVSTNGYDSRDWLTRTVDPLKHATLYTNDADGRLISVADPLKRITTFSLDADGRKLATVNAANETNSQTFDARGSLLKLTDGAGHFSLRNYDAAGNQIVLTNRNGKKWQFQFDGANRLTNTITPLGYSNSMAFNHQGLPASIKDQAGQMTSLSYDAKGRLVNRTDNAGTNFYYYDANNNRTSVTEGSNTNLWTFDACNHASSYLDTSGNLIQYRYDANGNVTNLIYPGNRTVTYSYDSLNRMTNVTDWAGRKSSIAYDRASHITSITRPNGSYRTISYDAAGEATNILEQMANTLPIAIFKYNWTNSGSMAWEFAAPLPHTAAVPTRTMTYDADNRLATFALGTSGTLTVGSDADGNLTNAPLMTNVLVAYAYDPRNRLLNAGGVANTNDAINNRIGQTFGTNTTTFVVNPNAKLPQVLMRIKNGVTNYYIYGPGLLYQITEAATGTNTLTYHYDFRGSTIALSADNGLVTDRIEYSAYGLTTYRAGTNDTPFLFNGRYGVQTDPNGLLYMRARYYNPYLCRFLNPDPSGFAGGLNFYAYANGNPVSLLDPFGLNAAATGDSFFTWLPPSQTDVSWSDGIPTGAELSELNQTLNPMVWAEQRFGEVYDGLSYQAGNSGNTLSLGSQIGSYYLGTLDVGLAVLQALGLGSAVSGAFAAEGGSQSLVQMNSYLMTQGEGRMVAGYYISGNSGLVGSTYNVNIYALAAVPGEAQGPFALVNALNAEASAVGASQISILGNSVGNPMLLNINPAVAGRLGFLFQQINPTTVLLQGAVP